MNLTSWTWLAANTPNVNATTGSFSKPGKMSTTGGQYKKSDLLGVNSFSLKMYRLIEFPFKAWLAMQTLGVDTCIRISRLFVPNMDDI